MNITRCDRIQNEQTEDFVATQCPRHNFIGPICSGKGSFSRRSEPLDASSSVKPRFYHTSDQGYSYFALSFLQGQDQC